MEVHCVSFGPVRDVIGQKSVSVELDEGATVADAFDVLRDSYEGLESHLGSGDGDDGGPVGRQLTVMVDGTSIKQLDGLDTTLEDGTTLRLAPAVVGGSR